MSVVISILLLITGIQAQEWRKIQPLESTCKDVIELLRVDACRSPVTTYKFPNLWININVSDDSDDSGRPNGTITRVMVTFVKALRIEAFRADLEYLDTDISEFDVLPDDDLPDSRIFVNTKRGISFTVQSIDAGADGTTKEFVTGVTLERKNEKVLATAETAGERVERCDDYKVVGEFDKAELDPLFVAVEEYLAAYKAEDIDAIARAMDKENYLDVKKYLQGHHSIPEFRDRVSGIRRFCVDSVERPEAYHGLVNATLTYVDKDRESEQVYFYVTYRNGTFTFTELLFSRWDTFHLGIRTETSVMTGWGGF